MGRDPLTTEDFKVALGFACAVDLASREHEVDEIVLTLARAALCWNELFKKGYESGVFSLPKGMEPWWYLKGEDLKQFKKEEEKDE